MPVRSREIKSFIRNWRNARSSTNFWIVPSAQNNDSCRVESLLQKRTSPNAEDAAGYTALHYAARNGHESICRILISNGANVNAVTRCGRATALHRAATQCRVEIVKLLLKSGADVNIRDSDGLTALDRAIKSNCTEVCKLLTQESDLDITDMS